MKTKGDIKTEDGLRKSLNQGELEAMAAIERQLKNARRLEWVGVRATVVKLHELRTICRRHAINWRWYCDNHLPFIPRSTINRRLNVAKFLPQIDEQYGKLLNEKSITLAQVLRDIDEKEMNSYKTIDVLYQQFAKEAALKQKEKDAEKEEEETDEEKEEKEQETIKQKIHKIQWILA